MKKASKRILVAPLDWGLGHATRCIPVIEALLSEGATVILAGNGRSLALLSDHFPHLPAEPLPDYNIRYARTATGLALDMLKQVPQILRAIRKEHQHLAHLIAKYQLQGIISDNRYGLWHSKIPSVILCHQLSIQMPPPLRFLHSSLV